MFIGGTTFLCDYPGCNSRAELGTNAELHEPEKAVVKLGWKIIEEDVRKHYCQVHNIAPCDTAKKE